jgi:hypothetical protein
MNLPTDALTSNRITKVDIVAKPASPFLPLAKLASIDFAGHALEKTLREASPSGIIGPFPRDVIDLLAANWLEDCSELSSSTGQRRFVQRLAQLLATPGVSSIPALASYARFLTATLAHCRFVRKHFPTVNARAAADAADFHCKPNAVEELFPIIHQLYVLRSYEVMGDFAEFGCFKGYSSSMLSFACQQLGLKMHVFDSFEGLPPSDGSGYEVGQYAGSLDEVRENITRFGAIDAVQFHKGFFSDSLSKWRPDALMCLWMDVDLEVSARDLMVVADRLDPRGTVFSHECPATIFQQDRIVTRPSPDNPIAPMLEGFGHLGRALTGHHVSGYTGAFWSSDAGIPVLTSDLLFELAGFCA